MVADGGVVNWAHLASPFNQMESPMQQGKPWFETMVQVRLEDVEGRVNALMYTRAATFAALRHSLCTEYTCSHRPPPLR